MRVFFAIGIAAALALIVIVAVFVLQVPHFNAMAVKAGQRSGEEAVSAYGLDGPGQTSRPLLDGTEDTTRYGAYTVVAYGRTDGSVVEVDMSSWIGWWYFRFAIGADDFSAYRVKYWSPSKETRSFRRDPDSKWIEEE